MIKAWLLRSQARVALPVVGAGTALLWGLAVAGVAARTQIVGIPQLLLEDQWRAPAVLCVLGAAAWLVSSVISRAWPVERLATRQTMLYRCFDVLWCVALTIPFGAAAPSAAWWDLVATGWFVMGLCFLAALIFPRAVLLPPLMIFAACVMPTLVPLPWNIFALSSHHETYLWWCIASLVIGALSYIGCGVRGTWNAAGNAEHL